MNRRPLFVLSLVTGAILASSVAIAADDEASPDAPVPGIAEDCHTTIDPGFIATIEDRSNDERFVATFEDISNDTGFLKPVDPQPGDQSGPLCGWVVPLPERDGTP